MPPAGGRSPTTQPRPSRAPERKPGPPRPPRSTRRFIWTRAASLSVLRLGVLIGGLVIIADLSTQAFQQRTMSAEDAQALQDLDTLINFALYSVLGVLVVRETSFMVAGVIAGLFASLLDAIVTTAAALMAPQAGRPPLTAELVEEGFIKNLVIGTAFAGFSAVVYVLVQRSGGRRPR